MATRSRFGRVRKHDRINYRTGETIKVSSHNRQMAWRQAGAAWAGAGISGLTTTALIFEFGFMLLSTITLILTALLSYLAVHASQKATSNKRKLRAHAKSRKRPARKRPKTRKRSR